MKGVFSMEALVAAIWASAALATPLIAERLDRRDDALCPPTYTTKNGMNFTSTCSHNNPNNDAEPVFSTNSMQDCMEYCSRYWGNGEGCFGVVWREDKKCWLRNSGTSFNTSSFVPLAGIHSALITTGELNSLDTKCPETDLSVHELEGTGIGYTVHCGKVISNYDTCWSGYPSCHQSPYTGWYHATSLSQCMDFCVQEHPLCRGVSYNPGMEIGFANCWPKTGFGSTLQTPDGDMGVFHSITITSLDQIDNTCPESSTYDSTNSKAFEIHCGQSNAGTNITSMHMSNVTGCMEECATAGNGCSGIVFDSSLTSGYENCYLQNTTSVISTFASGTYALLTGSSTPRPSNTSSTDNTGNTTEKKSSKAWIAGPVIGIILGIAIIAGAILFFRRRKAKFEIAGTSMQNPYAGSQHQRTQPVYSYAQYAGAPSEVQHDANYGQTSELGGTDVNEMATNGPRGGNGSAKYAHNSPIETQPRHELA
ncbi:hypothetical protein K504DRAFT_531050 [Pleomassaria siparia CBS 279.74]|uniref:Apple domain-containing protein n=1 Tax=Pleomassaria siparia CBS 279.74 TaxID=1314801 RepID=A0A6G1KMT2_9PLEO|nr:hypothetical protein K504DRAFT_531050 [Pleomassaria siparia CBS 279.74]